MRIPSSLLLLIADLLVGGGDPLSHCLQSLGIGRDDAGVATDLLLFMLDIGDGSLGVDCVLVTEDEDLRFTISYDSIDENWDGHLHLGSHGTFGLYLLMSDLLSQGRRSRQSG